MEAEVARMAELREGVGYIARAGRKSVVLFRVNGEVFAMGRNCPHWGGPMDEGRISTKRMEVECPWHRFRFDLKTGACVASKLRPALPVYPVRIDGDRVFVTVEE
jgi:nitrite reductase/ring-hydroxylating ferredoxin subunit